MKCPGVLYSVLGMGVAISVALAVWLKDVNVFFSGALVIFSGLLWNVNRNTLALQKRLDKREHAKANPEPIFHDTSSLETHIAFNTDTRRGVLKLIFSVSNPGDSVMLIESVQVIEASIGNPAATLLDWVVRLPTPGSSPRGGPYNHGFPAPVFPNGLTEVEAYFEFHDQGMYSTGTRLRSFECSIAYRRGNIAAPEPANWRRQPL